MSYKTYITDALVCGSRAHNTSDKHILLFTREAGMLFARAQSVREERSKQRYALQDCSRVRATLVRGKGGWRVVGAEPITNYYARSLSREERGEVRDALRLLTRFLQGEESHEELYDEVCRYLEVRTPESALARKQIFTLRVLYALGYVTHDTHYARFLVSAYPYTLPIELSLEESIAIENALTQAHRESHL